MTSLNLYHLLPGPISKSRSHWGLGLHHKLLWGGHSQSGTGSELENGQQTTSKHTNKNNNRNGHPAQERSEVGLGMMKRKREAGGGRRGTSRPHRRHSGTESCPGVLSAARRLVQPLGAVLQGKQDTVRERRTHGDPGLPTEEKGKGMVKVTAEETPRMTAIRKQP